MQSRKNASVAITVDWRFALRTRRLKSYRLFIYFFIAARVASFISNTLGDIKQRTKLMGEVRDAAVFIQLIVRFSLTEKLSPVDEF